MHNDKVITKLHDDITKIYPEVIKLIEFNRQSIDQIAKSQTLHRPQRFSAPATTDRRDRFRYPYECKNGDACPFEKRSVCLFQHSSIANTRYHDYEGDGFGALGLSEQRP